MSASAEEHPSAGAPEWMVSYADMITILMAFFAVMFSLAGSKDAKRDVPIMKSLQRQFGKFVGQPSTIGVPAGSSLTVKTAAKSTPQKELRSRVLEGELGHISKTRSDNQATIGGVIYFDSRTSGLNEEQRQQLQTLAEDLGHEPQKIEIWGHTFGRTRDVDGKLSDDWNLTYARCNNTMHYLVSLGIDPRRIRIGVAAQFEPIYAGRDVLLLEKNSRVEVFMLNELPEDGRAETDDHPVN
jgi:chemotaxis protein MotB